MTAAHGSATVVQGDARNLPLADASVDLIVTSPPYWALRSYTDGGEHYDGQIGAEATPAAYIDSLIACTREWVRVLKPSGSLWVNLGDKYSGAPSGPRTPMGDGYARGYETAEFQTRRRVLHSVPQKSLIGLPWRYAIRCIDDLGLILRAEVIWAKPNGLPESVTDRVRRSHETWFHFVRSPRYFAAVDTLREAHAEPGGRPAYGRARPVIPGGNRAGNVGTMPHAAHRDMGQNPLGKLPGSVWEIATQPLKVPAELGIDHFAAYPLEWPRRIIQGWSPSGICTGCGEGRRPVVDRQTRAEAWRDLPLCPGDLPRFEARPRTADHAKDAQASGLARPGWRNNPPRPAAITGEACACPDVSAPTRPVVVLDPFSGTGTTVLVARVLGRHGIGVDMSADYCRLAEWRVNDPGQIAAAMQVEKPTKEIDGQDDLLSLLGGGAA